jgi:hypothetical protein
METYYTAFRGFALGSGRSRWSRSDDGERFYPLEIVVNFRFGRELTEGSQIGDLEGAAAATSTVRTLRDQVMGKRRRHHDEAPFIGTAQSLIELCGDDVLCDGLRLQNRFSILDDTG